MAETEIRTEDTTVQRDDGSRWAMAEHMGAEARRLFLTSLAAYDANPDEAAQLPRDL